jgi:hypothetical protein
MAETLVQATNVFHQTMEQAEGKQHALNYNLARNNLLLADMETREKYEQDTDWQTLDKRYSESYKSRSESIISSSNLSPYDRSLIESESAMIAAKGRIDMAARARAIEIDEGFTGMMRSVENLSQVAANESPGNRVRAVNSVLETIDSALEMGYFGLDSPETKAEALRDETTKNIARMSIGGMTNDEKLRHIGAVLGYRRGYGVDAEYAPLFMTAAQKYDLPADLLVAVGMQESSMNPNAVSPKGAVGVMQLMPATAKNLGVTDRNDPAQSIDAGAGLLRFELDRYDGDKAKALAAYNAGGKKLNEWIAKHGENWLEELPADHETKKYVNKLLPVWEGTAPPQEYLTATNTGLGPLTRDEVLGGKGTGLVGDFLHTDELAKMYDEAYKENKEEQERIQSQAAVDKAYELFPEDHEKRIAFIEENYSGAIRKKAETDLDLKNNRMERAKEQKATDVYNNYVQTIAEFADGELDGEAVEQFSVDEIPQEHKDLMGAARLKALENEVINRARNIQHPAVTQYVEARDKNGKAITNVNDPNFVASLEGYLRLPDFGEGGKTSVDLLDDPMWKQAFDRQTYYALLEDQENLKKLESAKIAVPNVGPLVVDALRSVDWGGVTNKRAQNTMAARMEMRLRGDISRAQQAKVPPTKLTDSEIREILVGYMVEEAYYDETTAWVDWLNPDNLRQDFAFTAEQMKTAYLPIEDAKEQPYLGDDPAFKDLNMYEFLRELSKTLKGSPADDENIARAYWAYKRGLPDEEIESRLRGE